MRVSFAHDASVCWIEDNHQQHEPWRCARCECVLNGPLQWREHLVNKKHMFRVLKEKDLHKIIRVLYPWIQHLRALDLVCEAFGVKEKQSHFWLVSKMFRSDYVSEYRAMYEIHQRRHRLS